MWEERQSCQSLLVKGALWENNQGEVNIVAMICFRFQTPLAVRTLPLLLRPP